ncbi:DNA polymerase [Thermocatellispora tengchongensis]|uniref:Type-4 uracil-DNA glycosylase n=1 Tax=Thermocatellispora tengchongensis TaxID=1073253 RepID=A0A840PM32_9ACTN|nr:UdgX family uracil-DNA binding protein [Thermocatellispora tengchongensis]MBB5138710.1 DNA polymerase [Thermocatellispora tengchongensis]
MAELDNKGAAAFLPTSRTLPELRRAAAGCQGCGLYRDAGQTVFGEGAVDARYLFVGEQPGDQEDRQGAPFVGPAGRVLDRAMEEAGIDRDEVYVTNAVKHFKFTYKGKRRIHQKPSAAEIDACLPWLTAEMALLHPDVTVVLGATAARALLGPSFRVTHHRGQPLPHGETVVVATIHPSAVLRAPDRDAAYEGFLADVRAAARVVTDGAGAGRP